MYFSTNFRFRLSKLRLSKCRSALSLIVFAGLSTSATADYQQALAARATLAEEPAAPIIEIGRKDIVSAFSQDAALGNKALSDTDVMVDLRARIGTQNHLERAAANLEPNAIAQVLDVSPLQAN